MEGPAAGYSLQDGAAILGVSINPLRKRIRSGQVRAERVERPQGYVWQVYLDGLQPPDQPASDPPIEEAPSRLQQPQQAPAQAEALATLIQATLTPIVAPLVAELIATRQTSERRADRIAELERENGRQGAELERAASTIVALGEERDALKASQAQQASNPGPVVPVATTDGQITVTARACLIILCQAHRCDSLRFLSLRDASS